MGYVVLQQPVVNLSSFLGRRGVFRCVFFSVSGKIWDQIAQVIAHVVYKNRLHSFCRREHGVNQQHSWCGLGESFWLNEVHLHDSPPLVVHLRLYSCQSRGFAVCSPKLTFSANGRDGAARDDREGGLRFISALASNQETHQVHCWLNSKSLESPMLSEVS